MSIIARRGIGTIDLNSLGRNIRQLTRDEERHISQMLINRVEVGSECLKELGYSLKLKPDFREDLNDFAAMPYLLGGKRDDICADWQWENVVDVLSATFNRKPEVTSWYCKGDTKATKTRMLLTSAILLGACHELRHKQKTDMQIVLLSDTKHEQSYSTKDFPIVRYLFDKVLLNYGRGKTATSLDIQDMIFRWERNANQLGGLLFLRRTAADAVSSYFQRRVQHAQVYGRKLFLHIDEADEGAGRGSCLDRLLGVSPEGGRSIYDQHGKPDGFALHYHWTATGKHLELSEEHMVKIVLEVPEGYQGTKNVQTWGLEQTVKEFNLPDLGQIGLGTSRSNNPWSDKSSWLVQFKPELVGMRDKQGKLILDKRTLLVKKNKVEIQRALSNRSYEKEWNDYKNRQPYIISSLLEKATKLSPVVMWSHLRENSEQMQLVLQIREVAKGNFLLLPYMNHEDPDYGMNFFKEFSTAAAAIAKLKEITGKENVPVVITGTAAFDRSNEFPQGVLIDSGSPAYSTETALVQKLGRNSGVIPDNRKLLNILLGKRSHEDAVSYQQNGTTKLAASIHTRTESVRASEKKIDFVRSTMSNFPIIEKAFADMDKHFLNKDSMLASVRSQTGVSAKRRMMGGSMMIGRLQRDGELWDMELFDIWGKALDWASANHHKVFTSNGHPVYESAPEFQRLLSPAGSRKGRFSDGSTTGSGGEAFRRSMHPYLDMDADGNPLGVTVVNGKAYTQVGFRRSTTNEKRSDRDNSANNTQIQLFYRCDQSTGFRMKMVSIGFRLKNVPAKANVPSAPRDATVGALLMSEAERLRYNVRREK